MCKFKMMKLEFIIQFKLWYKHDTKGKQTCFNSFDSSFVKQCSAQCSIVKTNIIDMVVDIDTSVSQ